jgi:hypothetical protein
MFLCVCARMRAAAFCTNAPQDAPGDVEGQRQPVDVRVKHLGQLHRHHLCVWGVGVFLVCVCVCKRTVASFVIACAR